MNYFILHVSNKRLWIPESFAEYERTIPYLPRDRALIVAQAKADGTFTREARRISRDGHSVEVPSPVEGSHVSDLT